MSRTTFIRIARQQSLELARLTAALYKISPTQVELWAIAVQYETRGQ